MTDHPPAFAILVRTGGTIDQFVTAVPSPLYRAEHAIAWVSSNPEGMAAFATRQEAEARAAEMDAVFGKAYGARRWRFDVIERRMVPRWFLVDPKCEQEKQAVHGVEEL